ncbi:hypothetical protein BMS3Bbin13_01024 [bacterium BMS3Bbin13]|nr:hypothetical protein BMS3Bbin13_01024 [bacterium BMS3Bbin13]
MKTDFMDAATRHWEDAELLSNTLRWANADHLYGVAAECALKAVMVMLGMETKPDDGSPIESRHKKHINRIWEEFLTFAAGRNEGRYSGMLPVGTPFADWDAAQRYAARREFSKDRVTLHRDAARAVRRILADARVDGSLP